MSKVARYHVHTVSWGAVQVADDAASTLLTLTATGAGVWAAVDAHETLRQGAFDFATGTEIRHAFVVYYQFTTWSAGNLAFRLRDVTNSLTIATATRDTAGTYNDVSTWSTAFTNLPLADARVELQYSLVAPTTCDFYSAVWDTSRWP